MADNLKRADYFYKVFRSISQVDGHLTFMERVAKSLKLAEQNGLKVHTARTYSKVPLAVLESFVNRAPISENLRAYGPLKAWTNALDLKFKNCGDKPGTIPKDIIPQVRVLITQAAMAGLFLCLEYERDALGILRAPNDLPWWFLDL